MWTTRVARRLDTGEISNLNIRRQRRLSARRRVISGMGKGHQQGYPSNSERVEHDSLCVQAESGPAWAADKIGPTRRVTPLTCSDMVALSDVWREHKPNVLSLNSSPTISIEVNHSPDS